MKTEATRHPECNRAVRDATGLPGLAVAALLVIGAPGAAAVEPDDAVGREFAVFTGSVEAAAIEDAASREFAVFAGSLAMEPVADATSREFSLFAGSLAPIAAHDAVTREFSIMAGGAPGVAARDAVAREFSILVLTPPVVILDPSIAIYQEGDAPLRIDAAALVENADSTDFGGGFLRAELLTGAATGDRLMIEEIPGGPITLETDGEVRFEEVAIGTFTGGESGAALIVTLNAEASIAATQALVRSIAYANAVRFPEAGVREIGITLADALVGEGPTATREIGVVPVNHDPVAGDDHLGAARDVPLVFDVASLLANDVDPDGDTPLVLAFPDEATTRGGSIGLADGMVTYTPPPGFTGTDRFTYSLSDPFGGVGTGMVTVYVRAPDDPSVTVLEFALTEGGFALALVGLPARSYQGFTSSDLASWELFAIGGSNAIGSLNFLDPTATEEASRFYRFSLTP